MRIKNALVKNYLNIDLDDPQIIFNNRKLSLLKQAKISINTALESLSQGLGPEVVILDINEA